jgi:hypothetical protein
VSIRPGQRAKRERLCRYVSRAPLAQDRLTLSASGQLRYGLKTPWRDGTTHAVLEPMDFIARLAALVLPPAQALDALSRGARAAHKPACVGYAGRSRQGRASASQPARRLALSSQVYPAMWRCAGRSV